MPHRYWRSLTRTVDPASRPVSVKDLKDQHRLDCFSTDEDGLLLRKLDASIEECERYTGRAFCQQTWRMTFDCFHCWEILIPVCPLIAVTAVDYLDINSILQTLDPSDYQADIYGEPGRLMPAYGKSWPATKPQTYNAVTVTWTAGYSAVPTRLKEAVLMLAVDLYDNRSAQGEDALNRNQRVMDMLNQERLVWL